VTGRGSDAFVQRGLVAALSTAMIGLYSTGVPAQEIRVGRSACADPVTVVARNAPLSTVLKRLADALHFEIDYQAQSDPTVILDERANANELVLRLVRTMNFSMEQSVDARCANHRRIVRLSILADGADGQRVPAKNRSAPQAREMDRIAREGLSDYLRSHGMDDEPMEALAVH
jgi:hypothetical protein